MTLLKPSTSTADATLSVAPDQPFDVSTSEMAGAFDLETSAVPMGAPIGLPRDARALEHTSSAETSQITSSHVGTGRKSPHAVPKALEDNWVLLARSNFSRKTYSGILRLAQEAESPGRAVLGPGSLRTFLLFWDMVRSLAPEPEVTLARNGNLVAEWHTSWNRHLDVEFKEDGMVLYGLFAGRIVNEGRDKASALAQRLIENGRWVV